MKYKIIAETDSKIEIGNDYFKTKYWLDKFEYFDEYSNYNEIILKYIMEDEKEEIKYDYIPISCFDLQDQIYLSLFFIKDLHHRFENMKYKIKNV